MRRALEIFLDFCNSGHIGEDEIYKIRFFEGKYVLPLSVVARVLLRMQRRYYDGTKAYIKNIVQCDPSDALPDHFVRLAILHWLEQHQRVHGPAGVIGFHAAGKIVKDLVHLGHDADRVRAELLYLVKEGCVIPEHLRVDQVQEDDLVRLTASGLVHLQLMANPDYLAACAEDTWVADPELAQRVAARIGSRGTAGHFSRLTTAKNAAELVDYLKARAAERVGSPDLYLDRTALLELKTLKEAESAVGAAEIEVSNRLYVGNIPYEGTPSGVRQVFEGAGIDVVDVVVPTAASGKNKGFAFVEVSNGRAAMEALDSDLNMNGRRLVVNEAHEPKRDVTRRERGSRLIDISERLYVGNLPFSATDVSVRELFRTHGFNPLDVYVAIDRTTRRAKGYAFVSMASDEEASNAIGALNGSVVEGRRLVVRPATPRTAAAGDE